MAIKNAASTANPTSKEPAVMSTRRPVSTVPRHLRNYLALGDFETVARHRLPRMIFGFVDGAVETGAAMKEARAGFETLALVPRVLRNVSVRNQPKSLFGKSYSSPFGISPLGGAAMIAYRGDLALAEAAAGSNIPMILSASSLVKLEDVQRKNPDAWFQAYLAGDQSRIDPMVDRIAAAGYQTLVVTADTPVPGNREHNIRSGFGMPIKVTPRVALDSLLHPRWFLGTILRTFLTDGVPHFENMDAAQGPPMMSQRAVRNMNNRDQLAWTHIEAIRRRWKGRLVIKGILTAADAKIARDCGADGVIVSNHGGRQLDCALSPMAALPEIRASLPDIAVMLDGGIRRGTDVLKALAQGADFVFLGRPFLYAAALAGPAGVHHAIRLLKEEIDRDMALAGLRTLDEVTTDLIRPSARSM